MSEAVMFRQPDENPVMKFIYSEMSNLGGYGANQRVMADFSAYFHDHRPPGTDTGKWLFFHNKYIQESVNQTYAFFAFLVENGEISYGYKKGYTSVVRLFSDTTQLAASNVESWTWGNYYDRDKVYYIGFKLKD